MSDIYPASTIDAMIDKISSNTFDALIGNVYGYD